MSSQFKETYWIGASAQMTHGDSILTVSTLSKFTFKKILNQKVSFNVFKRHLNPHVQPFIKTYHIYNNSEAFG